MTADNLIQAKVYRLEELRKYQSYYGPNTPYPVVLEINELEAEVQRLTQARLARLNQARKKKKPKKPASPLRMSQATFDLIATIAFIGLVFLLGSIIFAAYVQTRPGYAASGLVELDSPPSPTLRPTFTPTLEPGAVRLPVAEVAAINDPNLPAAERPPTDVPTPVPTITSSATPAPTDTPLPTDTPIPTSTLPAPPTDPPAPPTSTPEPSFPFTVVEVGNREFQKTTYHGITIYVAAISPDNVPIGDLKVVGDHLPSGLHAVSGPSDWSWSVVNCLDCDYIKQGNLKFEPGSFSEGVWNVYLADSGGNQLSPVVSLSYSTDPNQWVWDFIIFRQK